MKTGPFIVLGAAFILAVQWSTAQTDSTHTKLDTLVAGQKHIIAMQEKIYSEVYSEPLTGKSFGVEFNPAFFLIQGANDALGVSCGFMLFGVDRKAEIAFPVYYYNKSGDDALTHFNVDALYRRFLGKHQDGFYISVGLRYTYLKGKDGFLLSLFVPNSGSVVQQSKVGAHFGIGYRYYSESGLFWGTSIYAGRYFSSQENDMARVLTDDTKGIYDFEILKFGIAF